MRLLRGRSFSVWAMASRSVALQRDRSVPLGKYWRNRPLLFSLVGRCQGLCGVPQVFRTLIKTSVSDV